MILQSKRVWILNEWMAAQIEVSTESGKIERIRPYGSGQADMDFGDLRVVPGFIDVHTHGAYGFDTNDAEEEGLRNWVQNIVGERRCDRFSPHNDHAVGRSAYKGAE